MSVTLTNLITNGGFSEGTSGWSMHTAYTTEIVDGACHITLKSTTTGTWPCYQALNVASGHIFYMAAKVKSAATNVSGPRVYLSYLNSETGATSFANKITPTTYSNDGEWHTFTQQATINANSTMTRIAFGVSDCSTIGDNIWVDDLMIVDLTACFGAGNEPDLAWCQANIPFFDGSCTIETLLLIASASFSPNPVAVGSTTKLSVSVIEIVQRSGTQAFTAGEFTAGEV